MNTFFTDFVYLKLEFFTYFLRKFLRVFENYGLLKITGFFMGFFLRIFEIT